MVLVTSAPALGAKPMAGGKSGSTAGNDISYPQCGGSFPASPAFAIVGVNDGRANTLNPCLGPTSSYTGSELYWAVASSTGGTSQPKTSLYINTADPGNMYNGTPVADWPTSSIAADPYSATPCSTVQVTSSTGTYMVGANVASCAWQYGYNRATQDVAWLAGAASAINAQESHMFVTGAASGYPWWLDVETANSWQSASTGQSLNVAVLQGMLAGFTAAGATSVGAYSTSTQWNQITGGTPSTTASLYGMADWIPGAKSASAATRNCGLPSFTGGRVVLTQWTGNYDNDHAC